MISVPGVSIHVAWGGLRTTVGHSGRGGPQYMGGSPVPGARPGISLSSVGYPRHSGPLPTGPHLIPGTRVDLGGGETSRMTSPGFSQFKALLVDPRRRRYEIRADVLKARLRVGVAWTGTVLAWASLAAAIRPVRRILATALARRSEVANLEANLEVTRIRGDFDMESEIAKPHRRMQASFDEMSRSRPPLGAILVAVNPGPGFFHEG